MEKVPGSGPKVARKDRRESDRVRQMLDARRAAGREHPIRWPERLGKTDLVRPDGPLVWIHVATEKIALDFLQLIERMRLERDELNFLITTEKYSAKNPLAGQLTGTCFHQFLPLEDGHGLAQFLDHWKPDTCIWADRDLRELVFEAIAKNNIPLFMVNASFSDDDQHRLRWFPGAARKAFNQCECILAIDGRSAHNMKRLGVDADRIEILGYMHEGAPPLDCVQSERDKIAAFLAARPIWLAAGIAEAEEELVLSVHKHVSRRSHRLLLILVPDDKTRGPKLAADLEHDGWTVGLRSAGQTPEQDTQIYVADLAREMGLWFRISPVSFIGCSLFPNTGKPRNPYQATALGSAVLHGPERGVFAGIYDRLHTAGAAREVACEKSLADELEILLAPDKVAEMARAAWEVSTSGAEVTDRLCTLVFENLDARGI